MLVLNDYQNYYATLSKENNTTTMKIKILHTLAKEIFKAINNTNPHFMKGIFIPKRDPKIRPYGVLVINHESLKYFDKSLKALGPKTWYQLPSNIKPLTSITKFEE